MGAAIAKSQPSKGRRRRHAKPMAEINITPFVDVMLVLLIIFMVAAPMLMVGIPLKLPKTAAKALPSEIEEPLTISITANGDIAILKTIIPREGSNGQSGGQELIDTFAVDELIGKVTAIVAERSSKKLYVRADASIRYEIPAQVLGALRNAGFEDYVLVTEPGGPTFNGKGGQ